MEGAIALANALAEEDDLQTALAAYEARHRPDAESLQRAAIRCAIVSPRAPRRSAPERSASRRRASVKSLADRIGKTPLDVIINNAGILRSDRLEELDFLAIEQQFRVNSVGPLRVTAALLGNRRSGSKVTIITSRMGSITDNTSGDNYGYRMSKAAVNMAAMSLARDLAEHLIAVAVLHPGWVRTDMTGGNGLIGPTQAAAGLIARIDELSIENTGSFWHANGERLPW